MTQLEISLGAFPSDQQLVLLGSLTKGSTAWAYRFPIRSTASWRRHRLRITSRAWKNRHKTLLGQSSMKPSFPTFRQRHLVRGETLIVPGIENDSSSVRKHSNNAATNAQLGRHFERAVPSSENPMHRLAQSGDACRLSKNAMAVKHTNVDEIPFCDTVRPSRGAGRRAPSQQGDLVTWSGEFGCAHAPTPRSILVIVRRQSWYLERAAVLTEMFIQCATGGSVEVRKPQMQRCRVGPENRHVGCQTTRTAC